ncbi:asparaginase [Ensifer sp. IC4062]|nr:asparaginase [Ensifer sp. IC4062]
MTCIWLIMTGGTIASRYLSAPGHVDVDVAGRELREQLRDIPSDLELQVDEFLNVVSCAITLPMAFDLAKRINAHLAEEACRGVVVTHGTDAMEESAYLADFLVINDKPVIFTGAQRSADDPAADGPRNLSEAIRLANSQVTLGLGVVVHFDQRFHSAREVTKSHTSRADAFASRDHSQLGEIEGERIILARRPELPRKSFQAKAVEPDVDLIRMAQGADGRLVRCAARSGAKAIILEGFGRGNATPSVAAAVGDVISAGVPVFVASRCHEGRVAPVYGNGGGKDLERAGCIFGGDLAGPKLRVLVSLLLGLGMTPAEMAREVAELGG